MIDRPELIRVANELGLEPRIVEKDYLLGWLLADIYCDPVLSDASPPQESFRWDCPGRTGVYEGTK